jgi:protease-4
MSETIPPQPPGGYTIVRPSGWTFRPWVVVLSLLAIALFFGTCGAVAGAGLGHHEDDDPYKMRETLIDGEKTQEKKIAVITIEGMIMETMGAGGTVNHVYHSLKAIEKDKNVVGVLLAVDTPGGGVTASDRIYHDIKEFKERTRLPVHAMFYDVAASGGYYVAMAADRITAHPTTITGSIGVISKFYNVSGAMDKLGLSVNVIKSLNSKGKASFKDIGSPYRPMSPEERALIQGLITEMWNRFTSVVIAGREGKMKPQRVKDLADGRVFTGAQALKEGLVDAVGYKEDAYKALREAAKQPDAKIVSFDKEPGLREMLGFSSAMAGSESMTSRAARQLLSDQASFLYLWTAGSISAEP